MCVTSPACVDTPRPESWRQRLSGRQNGAARQTRELLQKRGDFQRPSLAVTEYIAEAILRGGKPAMHAPVTSSTPKRRSAGRYLQDPHGKGFRALDVLPQRGAS